MKIALKRDFVLYILKQDVDDPQEGYLLDRMTDAQLYKYFDAAGCYISYPEECIGIVKEIPTDCIDGEIIEQLIGFPLELELYQEELKISN